MHIGLTELAALSRRGCAAAFTEMLNRVRRLIERSASYASDSTEREDAKSELTIILWRALTTSPPHAVEEFERLYFHAALSENAEGHDSA